MSSSRSWTDEDLRRVVPLSDSITDLLRRLGLCTRGGNPKTVKKYLKSLGLDTSHFTRGARARARALRLSVESRTLKEKDIFILGSKVSSSKAGGYIIRHGLLPYVCSWCDNTGFHNGKTLRLQLDHKNGVRSDNRLSNLRWLCPNCRSQTATFCGRCKALKCRSCGRVTFGESGLCKGCCMREQHKNGVYDHLVKGVWPDTQELSRLVWKQPVTVVASKIGVSSSMVKKHCKSLGINTPPRGYWAKRKVET